MTGPRDLLIAGGVGMLIGSAVFMEAMTTGDPGRWLAAWAIMVASSGAFLVGVIAYGVSLGVRHADGRRDTHRTDL